MTKEAASRLIANYAIVKYSGVWDDIKDQIKLLQLGMGEGAVGGALPAGSSVANLGPRPASLAYTLGRTVGRHPFLTASGLVGGGALLHKLLARKKTRSEDEE